MERWIRSTYIHLLKWNFNYVRGLEYDALLKTGKIILIDEGIWDFKQVVKIITKRKRKIDEGLD